MKLAQIPFALLLTTAAAVTATQISPPAGITGPIVAKGEVSIAGPVTLSTQGEILDFRFLGVAESDPSTIEPYVLYEVPEGKCAYLRLVRASDPDQGNIQALFDNIAAIVEVFQEVGAGLSQDELPIGQAVDGLERIARSLGEEPTEFERSLYLSWGPRERIWVRAYDLQLPSSVESLQECPSRVVIELVDV